MTLVTEYEWDALSRLTRKHQTKRQNGAVIEDQDDSHYTYQPQMDTTKLATATNGTAQLSFSNEAVPPFSGTGYSVAATDPSNALGLIQDSFTVTPDITGEIRSITNQAGATIFTAQYDPAGRMTNIASGNYVSGQSLGFGLAYDSFGRKKQVTSSAGLTSGPIGYDLLNRLTALSWSGLDGSGPNLTISETPTYDPLTGDINSITREFGTFNFQNDPLDQLTAVAYSGTQPLGAAANRSWQYDFNGNRKNASTSVLANVLLQDENSSYLPDALGTGSVSQKTNRATAAIENFVYRTDGKLTQYSNTSVTANYYMDALGRRVAKNVIQGTDPAFTQSFVFLADQDRTLLGKDGTGATTIYLDGQGIDEHLGQVNGTGSKAYATDHLGSVLNGDPAGTARAFGAFGESLGTAAKLTASTDPAAYGYTGRNLDVESGNYYYRARMYDPAAGRFTSKDPIGFRGGQTNLYEYAGNNPVSFVDPSGLVCEYQQGTGKLSCWYGPVGPADPYLTGTGYSGASPSINNPASQSIPDGGVIPKGVYTVGPPDTMSNDVPGRHLSPDQSNVCPPGRDCSSYWIHGGHPNHSASTGCMIFDPNTRNNIPTGETLFVVE